METGNSKIVVFGGTGHYGSMAVQYLLKKNASVRVVSRDREKVLRMFGNRAEAYEGDVTDRKTVTGSLLQREAMVICLSAVNRKQFRHMKEIERDAVLNIIEEGRKLGVNRLVYMSGYEIKEPLQLLRELDAVEVGEIKLEIETKIKQSSLNWTVLGNAPSFELFFALLRNKKILAVPGGGMNPLPCVSASDVGEITAQASLRNDLNGTRFKLTGPKAYSFPEVAELMTKLTGKKVKHIKIPLDVFNIISGAIFPFNPFLRYIYKSLKLLNNFPGELAEQAPAEHQRLREVFHYEPETLEMEIKKRLGT